MPDITDDLVAFWAALDDRLERVVPVRWGAVVTDRRFPDVWDANYARVETGDEDLSLAEVARALGPAIDAAGAAAFHVVMFRPQVTTRLLAELSSRGDRLSWDVVMCSADAPSGVGEDRPDAPGRVEELSTDDELWERLGASLASFGITEPEIVRQLLRLEREAMDPGHIKRWFGLRDERGRIVTLAALVLLAGLAYVDHVVTFPEARGRGNARAVVTRLLREARASGARRTFLLVDPEGPVALYERLGFREATRIASTLAVRQTTGGGR
jgi:ribosomal protein S18 acetylase RimI-like enzyme